MNSSDTMMMMIFFSFKGKEKNATNIDRNPKCRCKIRKLKTTPKIIGIFGFLPTLKSIYLDRIPEVTERCYLLPTN